MIECSLGESFERKWKPKVSNSEALDVILISWMVEDSWNGCTKERHYSVLGNIEWQSQRFTKNYLSVNIWLENTSIVFITNTHKKCHFIGKIYKEESVKYNWGLTALTRRENHNGERMSPRSTPDVGSTSM